MTSYNHKSSSKGFRDGNIPLYFQFFLRMKNDILLGEIEAGSRVPTIEDLHLQYGVSQATLRRALSLLEKEGLILKKRGVGIIVREQVDLPIWSPSSLTDLKQRALTDLRPTVLDQGWITPPRRIRASLGDHPDTYRDGLLFWVRRLWISDQDSRRKRVADAFYPADFVARVGEASLVHSTFIEQAAKHLPHDHIRIHQTLRPWICDPATADILAIPDGTPVFHRTWIFFDPQGRPLSVSETVTTANSLVREFVTELSTHEEPRGPAAPSDKGDVDDVHPSLG